MTERSIVHAWKACVPKGTRGSNPRPSAMLFLPPNESLRGVALRFLLRYFFRAPPLPAQAGETASAIRPCSKQQKVSFAGKFDDALTLLDQLDKAQSGNAESLDLRGAIYLEQGKLDEAKKAFQAASQSDTTPLPAAAAFGRYSLARKAVHRCAQCL